MTYDKQELNDLSAGFRQCHNIDHAQLQLANNIIGVLEAGVSDKVSMHTIKHYVKAYKIAWESE